VTKALIEERERPVLHTESEIAPSLLPHAMKFVGKCPWGLTGISVLILIPCFWHKHIEACDLGSHVYNAWLAVLVDHGQAPGLYIARQWNNVLADIFLARLGDLFGWNAAEKIVVSAAVLIFFWGAFALMSAASLHPPWLLVPAIAMITYGWTFNISFLNFYLSLGLAFWSLALLWRGRGGELLVGGALLPLVCVASGRSGLAYWCGRLRQSGDRAPGAREILALELLCITTMWCQHLPFLHLPHAKRAVEFEVFGH
jgi:hypothetical protein